MAKTYPTFRHPSLGVPVRLTAEMAKALAQRARQSGHSALGYEEGAKVVAVRCPLCAEPVRGYHGGGSSARTATPVVEHLRYDCSAVTYP